MKKESAWRMVLIICLAFILALFRQVDPAKALYATTEIDINADGSVTPSNAPIVNVNNTYYTLTDDVNVTGPAGNPYMSAGIRFLRSDITFNGNGHIMTSGWSSGNGFVINAGVNDVTIENSTATGFNICLFLDSNSAYNIVRRNNFTGFGPNDCIRLQQSGNNYFEKNTIIKSEGTCVSMAYGGPNNTFVENYIFNNQTAIVWSLGGGGAKFYHNTIGGGVLGPYGPACTWDNGYPLGGNYWIGFVSQDLFSGPGQNITGSDGIADTKKVIDGDDVDNYPLMSAIFVPEFSSTVLLAVLMLSGLVFVCILRRREL